MTAPNGESPDATVFPPFFPGAAPRPRAGEPPRPEAPADEAPPADSPAEAAGSPAGAMPWDAEPFGAEAEPFGAGSDTPAGGEPEDLPWLEVPPGSRQSGDEAPGWDAADAEPEAGDLDFALDDFGDGAREAAEPDIGDLDLGALGLEPAAGDSGAAGPAGGTPDWMTWDARDSDEAVAEIEREGPVAGAEDVVPAIDDLGYGEPTSASVWPAGGEATPVAESAPGTEPAASAATPAAADGGEAPAGSLDEVAGRLERLARTLRERPGDVLAGASDDPLDLLVTAYAVGYLQGRGRG